MFCRSHVLLRSSESAKTTIALLVPSAVAKADSTTDAAFTNKLSVGLAVLLIATYGLGMLFSLKTHREFFGSVTHGEEGG